MSDEIKEAVKVLIVDDHEIMRIGLRLVLEKWPEVEIVGEGANGKMAITLTDELAPDVILMDLAMPEMDGIQATREIRTKNSKIGIIIFTSQTHAEDVRAALTAGVNGYCLKDVDDERLKRAVLSVADGDVWLDSRIVHAVLNDNSRVESHSLTVPKTEEGRLAQSVVYSGPYETLSTREREVLELLVKGLTNKEIGEKLFITRDTVKTHIRHIMEKLAAKDRTDAAVKAVQHKII